MDGLLLAGGKSSRMGGQHKGELIYENKTFTERMVNEFAKEAETIWISYGDRIHYTDHRCRIVRDIYPGCGPVGGIHAGLTACEADEVMVSACDMPFLKIELFRYLKKRLAAAVNQEKTGYDGVLPVFNGRIHPLAAIYRKENVLKVMETQIMAGNYRIKDALDQLHILYVDLAGHEEFVRMIQNVNTIEEYRNLVKKDEK